MRKVLKTVELYFSKVPIIYYILISLIKTLFAAAIILSVLFSILYATGIDSKLETALDLKYNSPILIIPMLVFSLLSVVCLVVGFLLYFHKYRRVKHKTRFYNCMSKTFEKNTSGEKR